MDAIRSSFRAVREWWRRPSPLRQRELIRCGPGVLILGPIEIGDYTFIGANTQLGPNPIAIGRYSSIGPQALLGPNQHPLMRASTSAVFYSKSWQKRVNLKWSFNQSAVDIGNDVWIGTRAIVLGGVAIGNGAVVAAGAIVTRNVAPYSIVAGVPARQIGHRFDSVLVATLLESQWWSYELSQLNQEAFLSDYYGQALVRDMSRGNANQRKHD